MKMSLFPPLFPPPPPHTHTHMHTHTHTKSSSVCTSGCTSLLFSTNENVMSIPPPKHFRHFLVGALACYFQLMKMSLSIPPPKHFRHFIVKIRVHLACYFRFLFPLEHVSDVTGWNNCMYWCDNNCIQEIKTSYFVI